VVTIETKDSGLRRMDMNWSEDFLYAISEPNIAYILLAIGSLGIIAEIFSPGLIFRDCGAISLVLAFLSLGRCLSTGGSTVDFVRFWTIYCRVFYSWLRLAIRGGAVSFIIGSLILFKGGSPLFTVDCG